MDVRFGNEQRTVKSVADLEAVLTEAARHQTLLFLVGDSGTLAAGVGHPTHAVLLYNPKGGRPPMHALGDATADSCALQPPLAFDGRGFFDRCAIPARQARRAAQAFFASSDVLPDSVVWEPEPVGSNAG